MRHFWTKLPSPSRRPALAGALAAAALLVFAAPEASAGEEPFFTHHQLKMRVKAVTQGFKGSRLKRQKTRLEQREVVALCLGREPLDEERLYISIQCGDVENNRVRIMNKKTGREVLRLQRLVFEGDGVLETKDQAPFRRTAKGRLPILCTSDTGSSLGGVFAGVITVEFQDLTDLDQEDCTKSGQLGNIGGRGFNVTIPDEPVVRNTPLTGKISIKGRDKRADNLFEDP